MEAVRVSVIVPAYQRPETITACLQSCLTQEGVSLEVVVVIDGCEATTKVVKSLPPDPRVVILENPVNLGVARSRNLGLLQARGALVAHLDADDRLLPGALARACAAFDRPELGEKGIGAQRHVGLVYGDLLLDDGSGRFNATQSEPGFPGRRAFLRQPFETPFLVYRKELITRIGGVDEAAVRCWNAGVIAEVSRLMAVKKVPGGPLVAHRVDGRNHSLGYRPEDCSRCASSTTCRLFRHRSQHLAKDTPRLEKLSLVLTTRCNLDCAYCFTRRYKWDLKIEDVVRHLVQARDHGATVLSLTGGEPSLYKEFDDVLIAATDLGITVSVISNGWNWPDDRLDRFVQLPGASLGLSLEGRDATSHDAIRGKGSFASLTRFLNRVRERKPDFTLFGIVVATAENLHVLDQIADWGVNDLNLLFVRFDRVVPSGNAEVNDEFSPEDTRRFLTTARQLHQRYGGRVQILDQSFSEQGCPLYIGSESVMADLQLFSDGSVPACVYMHMDLPSRLGLVSWDVEDLITPRNTARTRAIIDVAFKDRQRQIDRKGLFTCVECMERRNHLHRVGRWPHGAHLPPPPASAPPAVVPAGRPLSAAERSGIQPRPLILG